MTKRRQRHPFRSLAAVCSVPVLAGSLVPTSHAVEGQIRNQPPAGTGDLLESVLNLGPFRIRPHVSASLIYDDNIRISSTGEQEDVIFTIAPGILIGAGEFEESSGTFVSLDYTPAASIYFDHTENNSIDHAATFLGQWAGAKLILGLGQTYHHSSQTFVEAGLRVDRDIWVTTLTSRYQYSVKTSFEINARQTISRYEGLSVDGYNEWVNQNWLNYHITEKVTLGGGVTLGVRDVIGSANQTFEQGLVRATYNVTEKIDATASAGVEFQQFEGGDSEGPTLVFSVGGLYHLRENTSISLEAYRQDYNSVVLQNQNYTATGLRAAVSQSIGDRVSVSLGGGYQHASYRSTGGVGGASRDDDYIYVGPSVDYRITEQWDAGIFYTYRHNDSSIGTFDFTNNQVGVRSSFRF